MDGAAADLITEEMRGVVGKVLSTRTSYPISASDIRKWAVAVYYPEPPPEAFARIGAAAGEAPLLAPEEFNPFAWGTPGGKRKRLDNAPGYMERAAGITPPKLTGMVNGGSAMEYGARMHEGDVITSELSIKGYSQKQGKRGPLLLSETQDRWTNQNGELVKVSVFTLVRF